MWEDRGGAGRETLRLGDRLCLVGDGVMGKQSGREVASQS